MQDKKKEQSNAAKVQIEFKSKYKPNFENCKVIANCEIHSS